MDQGTHNEMPALLTARDTAKLLAISERGLWTFTKTGEIPSVRIGKSVRYDPRDLSAFVESRKSQPVEA